MKNKLFVEGTVDLVSYEIDSYIDETTDQTTGWLRGTTQTPQAKFRVELTLTAFGDLTDIFANANTSEIARRINNLIISKLKDGI